MIKTLHCVHLEVNKPEMGVQCQPGNNTEQVQEHSEIHSSSSSVCNITWTRR